jgi:protein tyrosine/serine phosphatase
MGLRTPSRSLVAVTLFASCAFAKGADSRSESPHQYECNPDSITGEEIPNFHRVDNDLYRGGHPSCAGLAQLESLGVRTFIDLGGAGGAFRHCESARNGAGIQVYHVKVSLADITLLGISDEKLRTIFALMRKSPKPVFVSCSLGRDRTGVITALYRLKRGEMSFAEAENEAVYYGYRRRFIGLHKALERYRDPQELKLLPSPAPTAPPPESVCRAKSPLTSARKF